MTLTDQIKNLNRKIMKNEVQYDLDRKAATISALSSDNLDKYEYLIGEDLGLKPSTVEEAKFDYSPLGKIFNKGLDKNDQKEGLFKRLENIENAQRKQQQNNNIDTKPPYVFNYLKSLRQEAKDLIDKIEDANDYIDDGKLLFIGNNIFRKPLNFLSAIYNGEISLKEAEVKQRIEDLRGYKNNAEEKEKEEIN